MKVLVDLRIVYIGLAICFSVFLGYNLSSSNNVMNHKRHVNNRVDYQLHNAREKRIEMAKLRKGDWQSKSKYVFKLVQGHVND